MSRKTILFFIFMLFSLSFSFAQLSIGFHGGTTFGNGKYVMKVDFRDQTTNIVYPNFYDYERDGTSVTSFSFGGIIETRLYSFLYLQSEINVIDHRFSLGDNSRMFFGYDMTGGPYTTNYSFKYIEIPILLKAKYEYDKFFPYVFAGAGVGLLYKAEETFVSCDALPSITEITKYEQPFITLGIGTEYSLNYFLNIFLTFRYSNSLVDIAKSSVVYFKPHNYDILLGVKTTLLNY
jgi:hypothetical protein